MRIIDLQSWSRTNHFKFYNTFDHPHFGMCANVDLKIFYPWVKQHSVSMTVAIVYVISRAANAIPEFRYRIRKGEVVEHEVVHPSITILTQGDLFSFCTLEYVETFADFARKASKKIAQVKEHLYLKNELGQDDLLYMTAIPWVSFTGFMHPIHFNPPDSIPRFAWGKIFKEGEGWKMPLGVQAHHALMDGIHIGRFYEEVQEFLDQPEVVLSEV